MAGKHKWSDIKRSISPRRKIINKLALDIVENMDPEALTELALGTIADNLDFLDEEDFVKEYQYHYETSKRPF